MYKKGMKVSPDRNWPGMNYKQLTAEEYTVKYSYMTDSWTWIVLEEFPDQKFNARAFGITKRDQPCFAVRTTLGGFLVSDLEALQELKLMDQVLGFKELPNIDACHTYFSGCAICDRTLEVEEKPGVLHSADMVMLPVCPDCCRQYPNIKVNIPRCLTYHDVDIDWWGELEAYGEMIGYPGLLEEIEKEIHEKCDNCKKANCHEDCSPGCCPYYLVQDYMALYRKDIFESLKPRAEERLRKAYPDPNEQ